MEAGWPSLGGMCLLNIIPLTSSTKLTNKNFFISQKSKNSFNSPFFDTSSATSSAVVPAATCSLHFEKVSIIIPNALNRPSLIKLSKVWETSKSFLYGLLHKSDARSHTSNFAIPNTRRHPSNSTGSCAAKPAIEKWHARRDNGILTFFFSKLVFLISPGLDSCASVDCISSSSSSVSDPAEPGLPARRLVLLPLLGVSSKGSSVPANFLSG